MKKLVSIMGIIVVTATAFTTNKSANAPTTVTAQSDAFKKGYNIGFCAGQEDYLGHSVPCNLKRTAPLPQIGQDTFQGGFVRGFKDGYQDAKY